MLAILSGDSPLETVFTFVGPVEGELMEVTFTPSEEISGGKLTVTFTDDEQVTVVSAMP